MADLIDEMCTKFAAIWRGNQEFGPSSVDEEERLMEIAMEAAAQVLLERMLLFDDEQPCMVGSLHATETLSFNPDAIDAFARAEGLEDKP